MRRESITRKLLPHSAVELCVYIRAALDAQQSASFSVVCRKRAGGRAGRAGVGVILFCFTLISSVEEFPLPLYEYECPKCKHRFERLEKLSASATDKICPKCGAKAERQVSSAAIQFKGSGWYVTDYAHKGGSETSHDPAEKPAPAKSDGKPAESGGASAGQSDGESAAKPSSEKDSSTKPAEKASSEKSSAGKSSRRGSSRKAGKS